MYWLKRYFQKRRRIVGWSLFLVCVCIFWWSLPSPLFRTPVSTVLLDRNDVLLGAMIAQDGQWRFPVTEQVPEKFEVCITRFEDKRFYQHLGVDPLALGRALYYNIQQGRVVSGGSTLTMQVMRLAGGTHQRTVWRKLWEMIQAVRLELTYNKQEILALYASHAPFGTNVVGLDAAAWRYFGRSADQLSWAEAATLAVLPNSPALVHPGRNRETLAHKRNRLLQDLAQAGEIDEATLALAMEEPLPDRPLPLPQLAPHMLLKASLEHPGSWARSTLQKSLQELAAATVARHHERLRGNQINNAAALIVEVGTGEVVAYMGNIYKPDLPEMESHVDIVQSERSPGSILKPLLYAAMLQEGQLLPTMLWPDIPTRFAEFAPQNYTRTFSGAVPADEALARSLNIPAVRMLQTYGVPKFHHLLQKIGFTTLRYAPDHYGLSLILGGLEVTMWDVAGVYAGLSRQLKHFRSYSSRYNPDDLRPLVCWLSDTVTPTTAIAPDRLQEVPHLGAGALWQTYHAMQEVVRPEAERSWRSFSGARQVAWKTGTSYGFRDAWAVGVTPEYVVVVWAGNGDGEGRPNLTGATAAAPILFDLFNLLPATSWFETPYDDLIRQPVCKQSGMRLSQACEPVDSIWAPPMAERAPVCTYHRVVHLDPSGRWQVNSGCELPSQMQHQSWFVLPPAQEWYYKQVNTDYQALPPFRSDCVEGTLQENMEFIYPPRNGLQMYIPRELNGQPGQMVLEVAHRSPETELYWHLDDTYIGSTQYFHQMPVNPEPGKHVLTIVDALGEHHIRTFEVVPRNKP